MNSLSHRLHLHVVQTYELFMLSAHAHALR